MALNVEHDIEAYDIHLFKRSSLRLEHAFENLVDFFGGRGSL